MDYDYCEKFFKAIGVDPSVDLLAIYISFKCGAEKMMELKKAEFVKGCQYFGYDDLNKWKAGVPKMR